MSVASNAVFTRDPKADELAFRLQRAFRALLDAMARPGELAELGPVAADAAAEAARMGLMPQTVALLDVLLDGQTSFCIAGDGSGSATREVSLRTHAHARMATDAAFCVVPRTATGSEASFAIASLSGGTLVSPHLGATVIAECGALIGADRDGRRTGSASGAAPRDAWRLEGPGIDGASRLECDRADVLGALAERTDEFPCGVDLVLVDGAGHLACVPRSSRVTALGACGEGGAWAM